MKRNLLGVLAGLGLLGSANSADLTNMSWEEIVSQAKVEGEVSWFVWYLGDKFRAAVRSFEDEYGINVTIPESGDHNANLDKFVAQQSLEKGDIDVISFGFEHAERFDLEQVFINAKSLLPEDDGRVNSIAGVSGGSQVYGFWGNQTGIAYDPDKVSEDDLPQTPEEFEAFWAANPGKFGFNYENGGSGPSFIQNVSRAIISDIDFDDGDTSPAKVAKLQPTVDFFNKNYDHIVVTKSNADSLIRLSDRELWMVPTWEDFLAGQQTSGEVRSELKFYIPSMGMNGGGNGVAIPKNATNPAAALVFMNWILSAETQTYFNQNFGTAPMNAAADDSYALVPNEMRQYRQNWMKKPFATDFIQHFIDDVILAN